MLTDKRMCEVAIHFSSSPHSLSDFVFTPFEQILNTNNTNGNLLRREISWTAQLQTLKDPFDLKRSEPHFKNTSPLSSLPSLPFVT